MDKLEQLIMKFKSCNNRVKSAVCRYLLQELDITEEMFIDHLHNWVEKKLIIDENGFFEVIIN